MVAGATGIDLALIVVAADEGVMPQTREHVAICELLGIDARRRGAHQDRPRRRRRGRARRRRGRRAAGGTALAGAPIVPVSAVTGEGSTRCASAAQGRRRGRAPHAAQRAAAPLRRSLLRRQGLRLRGDGNAGGNAARRRRRGGASTPPACARGCAACSTTAFGDRQRGEPGARCAVNLQGVEVSDVSRGLVVSLPDALQPTTTFDVSLTWLRRRTTTPRTDACRSSSWWEPRNAERTSPPSTPPASTPGQSAASRASTSRAMPLALLPGDRFIVRGFARTEMGGATFGGGTVLDVAPPHRRRSDPPSPRSLLELSESRGGDATWHGPHPPQRARGHRRGSAASLETGLCRGRSSSANWRGSSPRGRRSDRRAAWLGAAPRLAELDATTRTRLDEYHAREPLRPGYVDSALCVGVLPRERRTRCRGARPRLASSRAVSVALSDDVAHHRSEHRPRLRRRRTKHLVARILERFARVRPRAPFRTGLGRTLGTPRETPARPAGPPEARRAPGAHPATLVRRLRRWKALRERIIAHFESHDRLDTKDYKALIGTTRRTAVPLMEYFDDDPPHDSQRRRARPARPKGAVFELNSGGGSRAGLGSRFLHAHSTVSADPIPAGLGREAGATT